MTFLKTNNASNYKYTKDDIVKTLDFFNEKICVEIGGLIFQQTVIYFTFRYDRLPLNNPFLIIVCISYIPYIFFLSLLFTQMDDFKLFSMTKVMMFFFQLSLLIRFLNVILYSLCSCFFIISAETDLFCCCNS